MGHKQPLNKAGCRRDDTLQKNLWKKGFSSIPVILGVAALFIALWFCDFTSKELEVRFAPSELRIVLVGKTGAGKSATGNTILGREVFKEEFSPSSVTMKCEKHSEQVAGRHVTVIDTPGILHTSISNKHIKREIADSNIHVFLLVIRLGTFTEEERNTLQWIQENFGEEALQYTIVLFTGGDKLNKPVDEFLRQSSGLQELTSNIGGYHVFNNKDRDSHTQVIQLLDKIEALLFKMGGYHYFSVINQETQKKIRAEEERKREESERKIREEEKKREELERMMRKEEESNRRGTEKREGGEERQRMDLSIVAHKKVPKVAIVMVVLAVIAGAVRFNLIDILKNKLALILYIASRD